MSDANISLIDLSKQFYFDIDDKIKKQLCFAETLIISCGHLEGEFDGDVSSSEWTCEDSESAPSEELKHDDYLKVQELHEEEPEHVKEEEENDFFFYFFPDCQKPLPLTSSKDSIIIENGLPKINPAAIHHELDYCTCQYDKKGVCPCVFKIPCLCGAKMRHECKCLNVENICICDTTNPQLVCTCESSEVCVCHPDNNPRHKCICDKVEKPCICVRGKFPLPICTCETKPTIKDYTEVKYEEYGEGFGEENLEEENLEPPINEPCTCQKVDPKAPCHCVKGEECTCGDVCICDIRKPCQCETTDEKVPPCINAENKSICSCPVSPVCSCVDKCECEPKPKLCTCGNPDNCTCMKTCDCTEPCLCDLQENKPVDICTCAENKTKIDEGAICTCPKKDEGRKIKRVRAGQQGYRWCHDVDPRHTYFDFGYGRHDKISYKEPEREKTKILGLHDQSQIVEDEEVCPVHSIQAPAYVKKVRKPSLDCCSTVGGISINVEKLGEDGDKFLVQVVSHSSKEGAKSSSKLVSIVDCNLHTLEENRCEQITKKNLTKERRSYMTISETGYYNKVTRICGERHFVKRIYHSFEEAHNFLLEGANVVLLRYFGITRYKGKLKTDTVLVDGMICESVYVCPGTSQAIVNGTPLFVVKVERHIIEPSGFVHQTLTVLTLRGYVVSHEWADNGYIIHLNPLLQIVPEKDEIEPHEPLREKWRSDLQLFSDYLDFKSTRSSDGARYVTENGELSATIRDYLQTLLLLRPHDALHFTRHYFGTALSALDLPHSEYFDPCSKHVRYYYFEE